MNATTLENERKIEMTSPNGKRKIVYAIIKNNGDVENLSDEVIIHRIMTGDKDIKFIQRPKINGKWLRKDF